MEELETGMDEARHARTEKLRWHCRRALLELDILFQRFWRATGDELDDATLDALEKLLALEDHDLWELVSGRSSTNDKQLQDIVKRINAAEKEEH
jgi:antitoxin CptB